MSFNSGLNTGIFSNTIKKFAF